MQVVAHNMIAQFTDRQLNITSKEKGKKAEKLSSGYRINRAADDAAGLQISEKMRWQIRGLSKASNNIQDGVSLLQVADGALNEVHGALQRTKELSVQAANDTNTTQDREAIQEEVEALLCEIDRIGRDTEFNTKKLFMGGATTFVDENGKPIKISEIPVKDLNLGGPSLGYYPFTEYSNGGMLNLSVSTDSKYPTEANWRLVYGAGNTSESNVRLTYTDDSGSDVTAECMLKNMSLSNVSISNDGRVCERTYTYNLNSDISIQIKQKISVGQNDGTSQYYNIEHSIVNTGKDLKSVELLFNVDTAYNNDDTCEEYFIAGKKVENFSMYSDNAAYQAQTSAVKPMNSFSGDGFSIIDSQDALSFSEKIYWDTSTGSNTPETVLIGNWPEDTGTWNYYEDLSSHLGGSTTNRDLAFSFIWNSKQLSAGSTYIPSTVHYGIHSAKQDTNLKNVDIHYSQVTSVHTDALDLWIQSGATEKSGQYITIGEMNTNVLGLKELDMSSNKGAGEAITSVDNAINKISKQRTYIGAQSNRLEHSKLVDDNTHENSQAAESRLRDADMSDEIVEYSKDSILQQAAQAMLAQANQSTQSVLSLFQ